VFENGTKKTKIDEIEGTYSLGTFVLLNRISKFKLQKWSETALEFLLIVVGVFVGIQIDSWNEDRKERIEELEYLNRLYADISTSIERNQSQLDFMLSQGDSAGLVLRSLQACHLPLDERDKYATGLYQMGKLFPGYLTRGTINELHSTGKMTVIQNVALRIEIEKTVQIFEENSSIFPQVEGRINPHINYIDSAVVYKIENLHPGRGDLSWNQLDLDFEGLCQDRRFYTAVAALRSYTYDVASWSQTLIVQLKTLRDKLITERESHKAIT